MAKKKKAEKPFREPTRRQLSKWEREKKRQRIIFGAGIFLIAAALVISVVGWYIGYYRPLNQTVIRVNDTEFNMKYYINLLKFHGADQTPEYIRYLADNVIKDIEQGELIKQEALKLGFSVSDDAVKEELKSLDLTVEDYTKDLVRNQLLATKLLDEHFEYQVPATAEQAHIKAMLLESESQALEVRARLENSDNFTELAEELSLDFYTKTSGGDLDWHTKEILSELLPTSIPVEYAFTSEVGTLSQPVYDKEITKGVGYWLIKILERDEDGEEASVNAILLSSEEEALEVRTRMEAGEDFATLAKELSQLLGADVNEGNLSPITKDEMTTAFDEYVFNLKVETGMLSEPIRDEGVTTKGGYWLIDVLGRENDRTIEANDRDYLKGKAFNEWITSLWDDPDNMVDDSILDTVKKEWAIKQATRG